MTFPLDDSPGRRGALIEKGQTRHGMSAYIRSYLMRQTSTLKPLLTLRSAICCSCTEGTLPLYEDG